MRSALDATERGEPSGGIVGTVWCRERALSPLPEPPLWLAPLLPQCALLEHDSSPLRRPFFFLLFLGGTLECKNNGRMNKPRKKTNREVYNYNFGPKIIFDTLIHTPLLLHISCAPDRDSRECATTEHEPNRNRPSSAIFTSLRVRYLDHHHKHRTDTL